MGCFHFIAIVNRAAINTVIRVSLGWNLESFWCMLRCAVCGRMVAVGSAIWEILILVSLGLLQFVLLKAILPSMRWNSKQFYFHFLWMANNFRTIYLFLFLLWKAVPFSSLAHLLIDSFRLFAD